MFSFIRRIILSFVKMLPSFWKSILLLFAYQETILASPNNSDLIELIKDFLLVEKTPTKVYAYLCWSKGKFFIRRVL